MARLCLLSFFILLCLQLLLSPTSTATPPAPAAARTTATLTPTQCALGFQKLQFNLLSFDRYTLFFRSDSVLTLAEAGNYQGPANIEEYVRFGGPTSPYVNASKRISLKAYPTGFDPVKGTCAFLVSSVNKYFIDARYGAAAVAVTVPNAVKVIYDGVNDYIPTVGVFFSKPWMQFFFGKILYTTAIKSFICRTLRNSCGAIHRRNGSPSVHGCMTMLNALPVLSSTTVHFDGFDFGCRALHAVFAVTNNDHCAHISFFDTTDPDGAVKCQVSQALKPETLFPEGEMAVYRKDITEAGVDPEIGYQMECEDSSEWRSPLGDGSGGCNWVRKRPDVRCATQQADVACAKTCHPTCKSGV